MLRRSPHPTTPARTAHRTAAALLAGGLLLGACGQSGDGEVTADKPSPGATDSSGQTVTTSGPDAPKVETVPGMPPVVDPNNIYSEIRPDVINPNTEGALYRVYVPNEVSGTLSVIDPTTGKVIDTFQTGVIPQHVVPAYDMSVLYVLNNSSNTITPIDPLTGKAQKAIPVDDPYNIYFTPDGSEAIIVAEAKMRLDFADPKTFEVHSSIQTQCDGINHVDFSIDGRYMLATCEFDGTIVKIDLVERKLVGQMKLDITQSGMEKPTKKIAQPQDVRVSNNGHTFYVADLITDGVYLIDGESFTQTGFIRTGTAAHGLYPSRDGKKLYVVNRGTNIIPAVGSYKGKSKGSVAVLDFATNQVEATWEMPEGGSPDMGNLTPDGRQLWLGGRYDGVVYVFDTVEGKLVNTIRVGENPHGLTVWPQPGRYSFGHTGNTR